MPEDDDRYKHIDKLLNRITGADDQRSALSLRELFDNRVQELGISPTYVLSILEINYRALEGILDGSQKRIDFVTLTKLARFLGITNTEIVQLYMECLEEKNLEDVNVTRKRTFISDHFDLTVLRTIGVVKTIKDFDHVEQQILSMLSLNSIFEYSADDIEAAFSSGSIKPRNSQTRNYFIRKACAILKLINNPHPYEKQALVEYFPKIRWHSTDVDNGIPNVIRSLYRLGVTVIFQPRMPSLQLRGATLAVNNRPSIVLTDFRGFYPTLWFALIHELFHVIFDWDEILQKRYHLSDEENDLFVVKQKEDEANDFAREFLFPKKKMEIIAAQITKAQLIQEYAIEQHVHSSIIYANYAFDNSNSSTNLWPSVQKHMPDITNLLVTLGNKLGHTATAQEYATYYKETILNIKENGYGEK